MKHFVLKIFLENSANILGFEPHLDVLISIDKRSIESGVTVAGWTCWGRREELAPVGKVGAAPSTQLGDPAPTARLRLVR